MSKYYPNICQVPNFQQNIAQIITLLLQTYLLPIVHPDVISSPDKYACAPHDAKGQVLPCQLLLLLHVPVLIPKCPLQAPLVLDRVPHGHFDSSVASFDAICVLIPFHYNQH